MFDELTARKMANTAWEIINPGYIDSPEIKYHIELDGKDYLNIIIELGYKLKITIGDELNGDRLTVLEALKLNNNLGFKPQSFHEGDWCRVLRLTRRDVLKARRKARITAFAPIKKTTPMQKFKVVLGGR